MLLDKDALRCSIRDTQALVVARMAANVLNTRLLPAIREGDYVFLRVSGSAEKGYSLPNSLKLSVLRRGPFLVLKKVSPLAYRLQLPDTWRIHPVISVAHLEPQ